MSYNTSRYLNFLTAVEALTPTQRATIDDANPLAAYALQTSGFEWYGEPLIPGYELASLPIGAGGTAYEAAWHSLIGGGILQLSPTVRAIVTSNGSRLRAIFNAGPGRVKFGFYRAVDAVLLKDFADRAAAATTVYAPIEALIPFASL